MNIDYLIESNERNSFLKNHAKNKEGSLFVF